MPDSARASCAQSRPIPIYATNAILRLDGRASLPPCRGTSRGRMRWVGATCTAPTTHGRPKRMTAPEYGKIGAARAQRRRRSGQKRRLSPRRDRSLGVATAARRDGPAILVRHHAPPPRKTRVTARACPRAARVTGTRRSSARGARVRFRGWCDAALRCQRCDCGCSARCHAMRRAALTLLRHGMEGARREQCGTAQPAQRIPCEMCGG